MNKQSQLLKNEMSQIKFKTHKRLDLDKIKKKEEQFQTMIDAYESDQSVSYLDRTLFDKSFRSTSNNSKQKDKKLSEQYTLYGFSKIKIDRTPLLLVSSKGKREQFIEEKKINTDIEIFEKSKQYPPPQAKIKYYDRQLNQLLWQDVSVLDYSTKSQKFIVSTMKNGDIKEISRLGIYFYCEKEKQFIKAQKQQGLQIQTQRLQTKKLQEIISIKDTEVPNLPFNLREKFIQKFQQIGKLTQIFELLNEINQDYILNMKKCIFYKDLKKYKQDYNPIEKFQFFDKINQTIQNDDVLFQYHSQLSLQSLIQKCQSFHIHLNQFFTQANMPVKKDNLLEYFKQGFNNLQYNLNLQRKIIVRDIQDILLQKFKLLIVEEFDYKLSSLYKTIRRIDCCYQNFIWNLIITNINLIFSFYQQFQYENNINNNFQIFTSTLLILSFQVKVLQSPKAKVNKKPQLKKLQRLTKDSLRLDYQEEIEYDENISICMSLQETIDLLTYPQRSLIYYCSQILRLETSIITSVISISKIFDEEQIKLLLSHLQQTENIITQEYLKCEAYLLKFKPYEFLLKKFKSTEVNQFLGIETKRVSLSTLQYDEIEEKLKLLYETKVSITQLVQNTIKVGLFTLDLTNIKIILQQKSEEQTKAILGRIYQIIQFNIKEIANQYQEVYQKGSHIPETEQELIQLKLMLDEIDVQFGKLRFEISQISKYVSLFQEYYFDFDFKIINQFYDLFYRPKDIQQIIKKNKSIILQKEKEFLLKLKEDESEFDQLLVKIAELFNEIKDFSDYSKIKTYLISVNKLIEGFSYLKDQINSFNVRQLMLSIQTTSYSELDLLIIQFKPYEKLWNLINKYEKQKEKWIKGSFKSLNYTNMITTLNQFISEIGFINQQFKEKNQTTLQLINGFRKSIESFKDILWIVESLAIEAFAKKPIFWRELFTECKMSNFDPKEDFPFSALLNRGIINYKQQVIQISLKAEKGWIIEKRLQEMQDKLSQVILEVIPFKDTFIFKNQEEVINQLDEQSNVLSVLKAQPHIKLSLSKANQLEYKLNLILDTMEYATKCLKQWLYLDPIFSSEDIQTKLQNEMQEFKQVDLILKQYMQQFKNQSLIWECIDGEKMKVDFHGAVIMLDQIQKSLAKYLEQKRVSFPRFYFVSDEELVQILAQTKDPSQLQNHIYKCFEAMQKILFQNQTYISAFCSIQDEQIHLLNQINVNDNQMRGNIEKWLLTLEKEMKYTMKELSYKALIDLQSTKSQYLSIWPGQSILLSNYIRWTRNTEAAIREQQKLNLEIFYDQLNSQLQDTVQLVRKKNSTIVKSILEAMVVMEVHAKDIVSNLYKNQVTNIFEFVWISQLRYYNEEDKSISVRMINVQLKYGFEYQGKITKLVITALTDRCQRTLLEALHLNYGGAPEGPAGTGKSETVKDLAKSIGMPCIVFNCSDGLNYIAMGKFFKGLASSGSWCCFDEFNRIDAEVLSVVAQQIYTIQRAIREQKLIFHFEGEQVHLIDTCCINVTMNPGYAGRTELPDNLQILFRPCAMMVPDYAMIAEISLYSIGFEKARELSSKIVTCLKLCNEQLSSQIHYDFGMRALKAVLNSTKQMFEGSEEEICLCALINVNIPKFTESDSQLFMAITKDLFPDVTKIENKDDVGLYDACQELGYQMDDQFFQKCIQLNNNVNVRNGVMCIGESCAGKSIVIKTLSDEKSQNALKLFINPKALSSDQLYGYLDPETKQWEDGVAPILIRDNIDKQQKVWVIFDGPVDSLWIENLNTVLDDNKKLCLTSGEILKIPETMCMIFEIEDLYAASPATVSRCGMVYFQSVNWYLIVESIELSSNFDKDFFIRRIRFFLDNVIAWCKLQISIFPVYENINILTQNYLKLVNKYLNIIPQPIEKDWDNILLFCIFWSFGSAMNEQIRGQFNYFIIQLLKKQSKQEYNIIDFKYKTQFPDDPDLVLNITNNIENYFEYCFQNGEWIKWLDMCQPQEIKQNQQFHELFAQTSDTIRNDYFCQQKLHFLFSGPTGTGKSLSMTKYAQFIITCSGQTTANKLQKLIETKINKRKKKGHYFAEEGEIVIFIDDLNMPFKDPEGSIPAIELLRQWMQMGGWYDLETKEFKYICDTTLLGTFIPEKSQLSKRFLKYFILLYIGGFNQQTLTVILNVYISWLLMKQNEEIRNIKESLVQSTIQMFQSTQIKFLPTPQKSHYIFNIRDIFKVIEGMSRVEKIQSNLDVFRLWAHESQRVFSDRFIEEDDLISYRTILEEIIKQQGIQNIQLQNSLWSNCLSKQYEEIIDFTQVEEHLQLIQDKYNAQESQMKLSLIFFKSAIIHIIRISRILNCIQGHVLIIGMGGTGRSSVSKLANFIIYNSYIKTIDSRLWNEQLLNLLKEIGEENIPTTILFNDSQFISENMLEDVCSLMSHGEVSHLFPPEERIKIQEQIPYEQFIKNCKLNIHIILCMQPVGQLYRKRLRSFPTIINATTINWFSSWPQEAFQSTAIQFIPENLIQMVVQIHYNIIETTERFKVELRRHFYVTPTQYLQMLTTFQIIQEQKLLSLSNQIQKFETGVDQIITAENNVDKIKQQLFQLQPQLEKANQDNSELLKKIKKRHEEVDKKKIACEQEEELCRQQSYQASILRNDCKQQLDNVLPLLAQATEALEKITKDDMILLKSFTNPPVSAAIVMEGLTYAFEEDHLVKSKNKEPPVLQDYWDYAKKSLLNDKLIKRIKCLKLEQIRQMSQKNIQKLQIFAQNPLFAKEKVFNASKAAGNLALWIRAVLESYLAVEIIEPKKLELSEAEKKVEIAEKLVLEKREALDQVIIELEKQTLEYNKARQEKEKIEQKVQEIKDKLNMAENLIFRLSEEKNRWLLKAQQFKDNQENIIGDCILNSAIISYLGVFPIQYREKCLENWKSKLLQFEIKFSDNFSLQNQLSDPVQINKWIQQKLPNDSFSIDNAIIMKQSNRWPLMIDPQLQANEWIKNMENPKSFIVFNATWSINQIQLQLQHAIQIGYAVLLENVGESLDPLYEQILQFNSQKKSRNIYMKFGDKVIEYSKDFRFYITTKLSNPHYQPQVCVVVTMLNFQVTQEGLIDQMLNIVVKIDEPIKEEQRVKNINLYIVNKNQQIQTENMILKLLSEASGDILENAQLIKTLQQSKDEANEIEQRLKKLEQDQIVFNNIRGFYLQVAELVSSIYFIINDLSIIEPTYVWSLEFYISHYQRSIKETQFGKQKRVQNIIEKFLQNIYIIINRSLLDKDKFIFRFLFCSKVTGVPLDFIRTTLIGPQITQTQQSIPKQYEWLSLTMWLGLVDLQQRYPKYFEWICDDIHQNKQFWNNFYYCTNSYKIEFPQLKHQFHVVMLVKIIKPEQFISAINDFVKQKMGKLFIENTPFTFEQFYQESKPNTPLLCLTTPGADARFEITSLADKIGFSQKIKTVSLGQGQTQLALRLIKYAIQEGEWVLLQNCHVAQSFMPELEILFENQLKSTHINKEFRLWLTSQPTQLFPHNVLLKTLKLTYELPRGLKNNMLRSYFQLDNEKFEKCQQSNSWKNLFFSLSLFHACILERRKYGPLGWNVQYNFSQHDLEISKEQLIYLLDKHHDFQWNALHYLIAENNYGGRITDSCDRRLLNILIQDFLNPQTAEGNFSFSEHIKMPQITNLDGYITSIQCLPNEDLQLIGLHPNADIYSSIILVENICQITLQVLPRQIGTQQNTDKTVKQKSQEILDILPSKINIQDVEIKFPMLSSNSLNSVLQQEIERYNRLIFIINQSLTNLIKQIDGYLNAHDNSEDIYDLILDNKVPNEWIKFSYQTTKPLATYIKDLKDRLFFINNWINLGEPICFWLGGFFFVQSFLTGILQNYARKHSIPIDYLDFEYEYLKNKPKVKAEDGFYVEGIYLDAAKFDFQSHSLEDPENLILYYNAPIIHFQPTNEQKQYNHYSCPLYNTTSRKGLQKSMSGSSNFIKMIKIPVKQTNNYWSKKGVAMILQLN